MPIPNKDRILKIICLGFTLGIFWRSFWSLNLYTIIIFGFIAFLVNIILAKSEANTLKNRLTLIPLFILAFTIGVLRYQIADRPAPAVFEQAANSQITIEGVIRNLPTANNAATELILDVKKDNSKTSILIFAKPDQNYQYGDLISATGRLQKPDNFKTDQGSTFNYINHLKKDGVFYTIKSPKIAIVSNNHGNPFKHLLYKTRLKIGSVIDQVIPAPESQVMKGLVLGDRASFSDDLKNAFVSTGVIHLVAVSGYNMSLVADWTIRIFSFLPMIFSTAAAAVGIVSYIILTGSTQTAIRAGIMALLALVAKITGRSYAVGRALIGAGVVMIAINPFILAFDVSFQLSFIATIAVIFLAPKIEEKMHWLKWKWLRETTAITVAAYSLVLPFIIYKMGSWSLVAIPTNLAILPIIPLTMILGFLTGFMGLVSSALAVIPGKLAYLTLIYELNIIRLFARLPFAAISVPGFPLALVILIYALVLYYLFSKKDERLTSINNRLALAYRLRFLLLPTAAMLIIFPASFIAINHILANQSAQNNLKSLLTKSSATISDLPSFPRPRLKTENCRVRGPFPDPDCSPGAIFPDATVERICVKGYTKTVRNVPLKLRKQIFAAYNIPYPPPPRAYELDHIVPLAIGGSNDIANLYPEAAEPAPGYHEKDVVEVYLQGEVCNGRIDMDTAARQIASDWLTIYNNLTTEQISAIKKKYSRY